MTMYPYIHVGMNACEKRVKSGYSTFFSVRERERERERAQKRSVTTHSCTMAETVAAAWCISGVVAFVWHSVDSVTAEIKHISV